MNKIFTLFCLLFLTKISNAQEKILMFVSHEEAYYSEYIVALKAFQSAGYIVDVRSASSLPASPYMIPFNTTIEETANTLAGSSYTNFTSQFLANFGTPWQSGFNAIPSEITTNGSIHNITNMDDYVAFVIAGGTGTIAYRVDGVYESQGSGNRLLSAQVVQSTAEKLNALALDALSKGKVVLAQCHGASLPIFWRIPNTNASGTESLGISLLKNQFAAGYPQSQTGTDYNLLSVNYLESSRVQTSSPNPQFSGFEQAKSKLITSRDWYPQTVSYACRTVLNILESYPSTTQMQQPLNVLILHGGAINPNNCHYTNRANDIPCNYGAGGNLPADYTDIQAVLNANSTQDAFNFNVSELNLTGNLPFNPISETSVSTYLSQFDGIVFYKHWSTGLTNQIQQAIVNFVENGGGVLGLHHGMYNDIDGAFNKNILINDLFGVSSEMNTWSANLTNYQLFITNYGHFVNTYQIPYQQSVAAPTQWTTNNLLAGSNVSFSTYQSLPIYDEIYNNMLFKVTQTFGRNQNQVTPLFSNNLDPSSQVHTSGFVKHFNTNNDNKIGKLAYFIVGERKESISMTHAFGQVIRNAVFWTSNNNSNTLTANSFNELEDSTTKLFPNPANTVLTITSKNAIQHITITDLLGKTIQSNTYNNKTEVNLDLNSLSQGIYLIEIECNGYRLVKKMVKSE